MARARYDEAFRQHAVQLAVEHGPAEAARQLDLNAGTLRSWCHRAEAVTVAASTMQAATAVRMARWEERRAQMVHELGDVASLALQKARGNLQHGKTREAQAAATTCAILIDKAQLLSGGATSRAEHAQPEKVHSKIDELAARRNAA